MLKACSEVRLENLVPIVPTILELCNDKSDKKTLFLIFWFILLPIQPK